MKRNLYLKSGLLLLIGIFIISMSANLQSHTSGSFKYVGVSKCGTCHKSDAAGKQLDIWQGSKHSTAWKTLETPEADKIAADKGFTSKACETPACIKCHVLGKDIDPAELSDTFDKTQGVQCETCHGPGSEYKAMSIMKDKQKAIDNGMNPMTDKAALCTGCHNSDSPTAKEFKFDEMWAKIQHPKPGK